MPSVKMNSDELRFLAILESLTGSVPKDCIWMPKDNRVIFVCIADPNSFS